MLQIDDIMLHQNIIIDVIDMKLESPWHGDFLLH